MKERAVIIDLDGTLVNNAVRLENNLQRRRENLTNPQIRWDEFFAQTMEYDQPHRWCLEMVRAFSLQGFKILFLTGRMATKSTKAVTEQWLTTYVGPGINYELIMRKNRDFRKNEQIKHDILTREILPRYNVLFAIDDMKANIDMMRTLGIPALHCDDL